jgi:hypothetical protein
LAEPPDGKDRRAAVPPVVDPDLHERFEGFRETTLAAITDPDANATWRALGDHMYTMALEYSSHWPLEPEGSFRHEGRAAVADLRHLQGFLAYMAREPEASVLTKEEEHIARRCATLSRHVRDVADALEAELDAVAEKIARQAAG